MTEYIKNLSEPWFTLIKIGNKKCEGRLNKGDFSHNNMTPFLRKNVTQNTNIENMSSVFDTKMGNNQFWQNKKEVPCLFKPEMNAGGNVCSMKNNDDFLKSRINNSSRVNNFFPIEKIRVGPGINKGYDAVPTGGFQQMDTAEYAKPRNLDDLRSKINQKGTYFELPIQAPPKGTTQRSIITPFNKNKPDTNFEVSPDMWLKTTGAITKQTERPSQNIRPTARQEFHVDYQGSAKYSENSPGQGFENDYGKSNIILYNNERNITGEGTVVSNITSIVKAIVAPIMDAVKYTMKEYTVESVRAVGNPSIQIPSKAVAILLEKYIRNKDQENLRIYPLKPMLKLQEDYLNRTVEVREPLIIGEMGLFAKKRIKLKSIFIYSGLLTEIPAKEKQSSGNGREYTF
jgi:hypothetical protein